MTRKLSPSEVRELGKCEAIVRKGMKSYVEVGFALARIQEGKLFLQDFPSFKAYTKSRLGISGVHARDLIRSSMVAAELRRHNLPIPSNASFARTLAPLDPKLQVEVWRECVESDPTSPPTPARLRAAILEVVPRPVDNTLMIWKRLAVPVEVYTRLKNFLVGDEDRIYHVISRLLDEHEQSRRKPRPRASRPRPIAV